jgi:hypothetical protein
MLNKVDSKTISIGVKKWMLNHCMLLQSTVVVMNDGLKGFVLNSHLENW